MSRIGLHIVPGSRNGYGPFLAALRDAGVNVKRIVVKAVGDFSPAREAKNQLGDKALTVGRLTGWGWEGFDQYVAGGTPPEILAPAIFRQVYEPVILAHPEIDIWEPINEWSNHWRYQADLFIALAPHFEEHGKRMGIYAFSTGNPPRPVDDGGVAYQAIVHACAILRARGKGHVLTSHEYGGVGTSIPTLKGTQPYLALRYRALYDVLRQNSADIPLVVSECGQHGGYEFIGTDAFIEDYAWYDSNLMGDDYVLGAAAWTLGNWASANFQDALPALASYIAAHPDSEPPAPPPPPPPITRTWKKFDLLAPPDTTAAEYDELQAVGLPTKTGVTFSADSAFARPDNVTEHRVAVYAAQRWQGGRAGLENFVGQHYTYPAPTMIEYREFLSTPVPPPPPSIEPFKLASPVPSIPLVITHPFNEPRDYDGDGVFDDRHEGVDLRAVDAAGNPVPVVACADGVVEQDQDRIGGGYGIAVVLRHDWPDGNAYRTWYAHLTSNDMSVGQRVRAGERIGLAGTTGNSTGIHLHLNLQWIGRGLSGYAVPDAVDPAPYLPVTAPPPPPPPPPPATKYSGWYGLGDAEGGALMDAEIECARRAGLFVEQGNPQGCWLWYENNQEWSWEPLNWNGTRIPYQRQIRRLDFFKDSRQAPHFYVNGLTGIWDNPIQEAGGFGNMGSPPGGGVVLGNEPNVEAEGLGRAWTSPADFCQTLLLPIVRLIRQHYSARYPALKLVSPPMSPKPNTLSWWDALRDNGILTLCHGMGIHTYWSSEFHESYPMETIAGGRNYELAYPYLRHLNNGTGGKLWITEVSNNKPIDSDAAKGDQYARWLAKVPSDKVQAVMFFAVQGGSFDATRETWVRQGGVISGIPAAFRMRWALIP